MFQYFKINKLGSTLIYNTTPNKIKLLFFSNCIGIGLSACATVAVVCPRF